MINIEDYEAMAKLSLPEAERSLIRDRAQALTESFAELERVNTDGVAPLVTVLDIKNVLREDVAVKIITRDELMSNAPEHEDGYFHVPRTLD